MYITVVDENFLSQIECDEVKNIVLSLKKYWQRANTIWYYLPYPLYILSPNYSLYKANAKKYNPIMYEQLNLVFNKLKDSLSKTIGVNINFNEDFNYPGFHINSDTPLKNPNFHQDGFLDLHKHLFPNKKIKYNDVKIFSAVVPISIPESGAGLLIRKKPTIPIQDPEITRHSSHYDYSIDYKLGSLMMWNGDSQHSIRPFEIANATDLRITLQSHVAVHEEDAYIFW